MSGSDQARVLLNRARGDLTALENMTDASAFLGEIFGFHAQQTVEKALKAWLAARSVAYPFTHDLTYLLGALEDHGEDVAEFWDLVEFGIYAVRFRYEPYPDTEEPLDRPDTIARVRELVEHVGRIVGVQQP